MNILNNGKLASIRLFALSSALLFAALPTIAQAEDIADFTGSIGANSPSQYGRLSRNGIQQDWNNDEAYPSIINTTTKYQYTIYDFSAALFTGAPYVDISIFDNLGNANFFASAYAGSYSPSTTSPGSSAAYAVNWLGDEGASGNFFGTDAHFFDVVLPVGKDLILVVNTSAVAGVGAPYSVSINAYADTSYDDPPPVVTPPPPVGATPEPSTIVTLGTGLLGLAGTIRRRMSVRA